MADTSDFKNGLCISLDNQLYTIVEFQHVKPGKGGAFVRTKLKNIENNRILDRTFNAGVKIETARIERTSYQFLYKDSNGYHFMNNESYDQIILQENIINAPQLLKEGQEVEVLFHDESNRYLLCELPSFVELKVIQTDPGVKGDTVNKAMKPATLETGTEIQVPLFINTNEILRVDTRTISYVERAKSK